MKCIDCGFYNTHKRKCTEGSWRDTDGKPCCVYQAGATLFEPTDEIIVLKAEIVKLQAKNSRLREALAPFAHPDLFRVTAGNVEGGESIVFQRNNAILKLKHFVSADRLAGEGE